MDARFSDHVKNVAHLQVLLPTSIKESSTFEDIRRAVEFYKDDFPNPDITDEEFARWKVKRLRTPIASHPQSLQDCLNPDVCSLPNILQLFATLPLSSCMCERSASAFRRLNTYLCCTQSEDCLSAAALIYTNYSMPVNVNKVCALFMQKHPRRMEVPNMLFSTDEN